MFPGENKQVNIHDSMLRVFFTISLFDMFYQNVGMHFGNIQYEELSVFKKNKCNVKAHLLYKQALPDINYRSLINS